MGFINMHLKSCKDVRMKVTFHLHDKSEALRKTTCLFCIYIIFNDGKVSEVLFFFCHFYS